MNTILIDADYTVFSVAAACQVKIPWDDDIITTHIDLDEARRVLSSSISAARDTADMDDAHIILCFSCPTRHYFRHDIDASYKSNRKAHAAPLGLRDLREWACSEYDSRWKPNLEADDVIGIMATDPRILKGNVVVCSADKDLHQVPGLHINPMHPDDGLYTVLPSEATRQFYMQVLTGDATDGYPGCPGVGPVKAARILDGVPAWDAAWPHVVAAYQKAGLTADDALRQARLAKILLADDYNHTTSEPILWEPNSASSTSSRRKK